jgi:pilus assembly protein Flp/PilA
MLHLVGFGMALAGLLRRDDRGASMVEYGLLLMLIAIVVVPALIVFGPLVADLYTDVINSF